jgi:hypothetical protein
MGNVFCFGERTDDATSRCVGRAAVSVGDVERIRAQYMHVE